MPFARAPCHGIRLTSLTRASRCSAIGHRHWQPILRVAAFCLASRRELHRHALPTRRLASPVGSGRSSMRSVSTTLPAHAGSRGRTAAIGVGAIGAALISLGAWFFLQDEEKLSPDRFIPLKILSVTSLTKDTSLFKLALPKSLLAASSTPPVGPIASLYIMQPDLQIQRPYTVR